MMWRKLRNCMFVCAMAAACALSAAEVRLASGGRTDYTIVLPERPTADEREAAEDLGRYLTRITGAKFTLNGKAPHRIYVGRKAPGDKKPLERAERRVRCENGDIYLYGSDSKGGAFAVYDFLKKFFGCRWYTFYGDEYIPKKSEAVFDGIDLSVVPSFNRFCYNGNSATLTLSGRRFSRAAGIYNYYKELPEQRLFGNSHVLGALIPPGVPLPAAYNPLKKPLKYFRDKAYFKTNPEFFSMDKNGKRIPQYQVCFSNAELRRTLIENIDIVIRDVYKGGSAQMSFGLNDKGHNGDYLCHCPECMKLCEKYGSTAGPYWEFMLELSEFLKRKYPLVTVRFSAYATTVIPPAKVVKRFPENLVIGLAPLGGLDFLRPYDRLPEIYRQIRDWGRFAGGDFELQLYPTTYPRPLHSYPLVANIRRLVTNVRIAKKLGITGFMAEFGCKPNGDMGFNELRVYLLAALTRDVNADVDALTKDFMDHYYGKASPLMRKYLAELEECEKNETGWMRYWQDHRSTLQYLTPANLLRWQGYFDEMERLTAGDAKTNLHVRRARTNLDEATMSVWYKFKKGEMPDRELMNARYQKTLEDAFRDQYASSDNPSRVERLVKEGVELRGRAMYYHYALAGKWRPLPEKFAKLQKAGKLFRLVPHINRNPRPRLSDDPEAAAGIAVEGKMPRIFRFMFQYWQDSAADGMPPVESSTHFRNRISAKRIPDDGKYHYYYVGTTRLYNESMIHSAGIRYGSGVMTGLLFDPKNPEQRFDVYISLKRNGERLWFDEMIFVKSDRKPTLERKKKGPAIKELG